MRNSGGLLSPNNLVVLFRPISSSLRSSKITSLTFSKLRTPPTVPTMSSSSSTFSTAMLRAVSPLASATVSAYSDDRDTLRLSRHTMYQGATTVDDLVAMVPQDYRHVLRDPLMGIANTTTKLCSARATLARWNAHKTAGTFPPHIRVRAPEVQLSKDFGEDAAGAGHRTR